MRIPFGKFEGREIADTPSYYLLWLINKTRDPDLRAAAEREYDHRTRMNRHWSKPKFKRMS